MRGERRGDRPRRDALTYRDEEKAVKVATHGVPRKAPDKSKGKEIRGKEKGKNK